MSVLKTASSAITGSLPAESCINTVTETLSWSELETRQSDMQIACSCLDGISSMHGVSPQEAALANMFCDRRRVHETMRHKKDMQDVKRVTATCLLQHPCAVATVAFYCGLKQSETPAGRMSHADETIC